MAQLKPNEGETTSPASLLSLLVAPAFCLLVVARQPVRALHPTTQASIVALQVHRNTTLLHFLAHQFCQRRSLLTFLPSLLKGTFCLSLPLVHLTDGSPSQMSEHNNNLSNPNPDSSRRLRFSHDEGHSDDVHYSSSPSPQQPYYTNSNPFADTQSYASPPPCQNQQPYSSPSPLSHSHTLPSARPTTVNDTYGYQDFSAHPALSVPRPVPAQTIGSGLPASGINRQGFAAPPYPSPSHTLPSSTAASVDAFGQPRSRYSSASQETLVSELPPVAPLKPALRRSSTEEHLRLQAAREAAGMVDSHLGGRPQGQRSSSLAPPPSSSSSPHRQHPSSSACADLEGWNDDDPEGWHSEQRAAAGILSNLLRLYGDGRGPGMNMHRGGSGSRSDGGSRSPTGSNYGNSSWEREQELRRRHRGKGEADEGAFPDRRMKRASSTWTVGTNAEDKVYAPEDPRARGGRRSEEREKDEEKVEKAKEAHKDAAKTGDELAALDAAEHRDVVEGKAAKEEKKKKNTYKKYVHKDQITAHVASTFPLFSLPPLSTAVLIMLLSQRCFRSRTLSSSSQRRS